MIKVITGIAGLVTLLFLLSCHHPAPSSAPDITPNGVVVRYNIQMLDEKDFHPITFKKTFSIVYDSGMTIYEVPVMHFYSKGAQTFTAEGIPVGDSLIKTDTILQYYLFSTGEPRGYSFDSITDAYPRLIDKDSFFSKRSIMNGTGFYNPDNDSLARTYFAGDSLVNVYFPRIKKDASYPDTAYFYFLDRKNTMPYSLSPVIEQVNNKVVAKVRIYFKPTGEMPDRGLVISRIDSFFEPGSVSRLVALFKAKNNTIQKKETK